jgi:hypothetical protein
LRKINNFLSDPCARSIAINYLEAVLSDDNSGDTGIVCVYFDYGQEFQPVDLLRSLLKDVILRKGTISQHVRDLHHKHTLRGSTPPSIKETVKSLDIELQTFTELFCVIDGLDESAESTRETLLKVLKQFQPTLRLMITGRPFVEDVPRDIFEVCGILKVRARDDDVRKFVRGQIEKFNKPMRRRVKSAELEGPIVDTVTGQAKGM